MAILRTGHILAHGAMQELRRSYEIEGDRGYDPAAETMDRFRFDLRNRRSYLKANWKWIRTTDVIERSK